MRQRKRLTDYIPQLLLISVFISCNSVYTSKKEGYFKIDFPQRSYTSFNDPAYPYTFEYPTYARIVKDSSYFDNAGLNPYWINVEFPGFNGKVFISYKNIQGNSVYKVKVPGGAYRDSIGKNIFQKMVNDAYNLTYKNDIKAYSIEDSLMLTPNNLSGIFFKISGNVATAKQFFLTDTVHHFLRGALYFDATPNEDSLRPVNAFLQQDLKHMINTMKWR
ncbi:MAG: hypothetical protein ABIP35_17680 [Ginsengibacter sp.]